MRRVSFALSVSWVEPGGCFGLIYAQPACIGKTLGVPLVELSPCSVETLTFIVPSKLDKCSEDLTLSLWVPNSFEMINLDGKGPTVPRVSSLGSYGNFRI